MKGDRPNGNESARKLTRKLKECDRKGYCAAMLFAVSCVVYVFLAYGGIRSPDSEIVFRTADSIAARSTFALSEELPWKGFGVPKGRDGRRYSLFGPVQALVVAPFIKPAKVLGRAKWFQGRRIPLSHYYHDGLMRYVGNTQPANMAPHTIRFIISFFNVFVTALAVALFYLLMAQMTGSVLSAIWVAGLFAFGTLMMPYSGTFFSEPLATLFSIGSFWSLPRSVSSGGSGGRYHGRAAFTSGLLLGLATATHISAALFAPFFFVYAVIAAHQKNGTFAGGARVVLWWSLGLGSVMVLLGYYNYVRFGNAFATGRTADPEMFYATFVAPWRGLTGLLWSSGKGLVWYCPAALVGLLAWRNFYKENKLLSVMILCAAAFRILFIASRSDWHGGFSLGPRYLVVLVPFLLIPLGYVIRDLLARGSMRGLFGIALIWILCISQQMYFSIGEIFSYFHTVKWKGTEMGVNVFKNDLVYFDWNFSPMIHLLEGKRAPFLLQSIPWSNHAIWLATAAIATFCILLLFLFSVRQSDSAKPDGCY